MRYITTMVWGAIFTEIIGFIASALTQTGFEAVKCLIVGAIFGLAFNAIPFIMEKTARN